MSDTMMLLRAESSEVNTVEPSSITALPELSLI